jgi:CBS domain-containing membrane protein
VPVRNFAGALRGFAGLGANSSGHLEKWVSGAGGLSGILGVMLVSQAYLGLNASASLVASMGASAVLLFAVPHGPLSQPWAVFGGHLVSAVIGVACAGLQANPILAAALAVALAISAMYYLRCIHPPGGATALTAVAGGEAVHALGFHFVLTPVLLNVLVILLVAMVFNFPFPWRRYPAAWARKPVPTAVPAAIDRHVEVFSREQPATTTGGMDPADIHIGGYYCNGEFSPDWQVRQVMDRAGSCTAEPGTDDRVAYRVVAGRRRRQSGTAKREAFAGWARYEVCLNETCWQRVDTTPEPATTGVTHEHFK